MSRFGHDAGGRHRDPRLEGEEQDEEDEREGGYESPRRSRASRESDCWGEKRRKRLRLKAEKESSDEEAKSCFPTRGATAREGLGFAGDFRPAAGSIPRQKVSPERERERGGFEDPRRQVLGLSLLLTW